MKASDSSANHRPPRPTAMHPLSKIAAATAAAAVLAGCATSTADSVTGSRRSQLLIVPESQVIQASEQYYAQQRTQASSAGVLLTSGPEYQRVHGIMQRIVPQVRALRPDAVGWKWELVLIDQPTINATAMAGGKVTFYTGLIRQLRLTDDEIAMIMGHEIAHALREHTREKLSQQQVGNLALVIGGAALGASSGQMNLASMAKQVGLDLPFSRTMESEADLYGTELAARAGYDPRAAITLWDKMAALSGGGANPTFLSTHPASGDRKAALQAIMPKMVPLYEAARTGGATSVSAPARR